MKPSRSLLWLLLISVVHVHKAAYCSGKPDPNAQENLNTIITTPPVLVKSVKNGHLYKVVDEQAAVSFNVLHVYGKAYDMGYAQGQLIAADVRSFLAEVWEYVESQAIEALNGTIPWLPKAVAQKIVDWGLDKVLDLEIKATEAFTPAYFIEELQGLADASNTSFINLKRLHLLGELTKASCSMFGAWGNAIPAGYSLLQLRALDWITDGPFQKFSQITVYHPSEGNAFANVGFNGFIGSFSGMSSVQTATSEIGVAFPDSTFGKESRVGIPFTYLLRDLLQFDGTLAEGLDRITNANRTCNLILGFGDGKDAGGFRGIQYSHSVANFFTDQNMQPEDPDWHPRMDGVVYYGMDWLCPGFDRVLHRQLASSYGRITPELAIRNITAIEQSGSLFTSYYDLTPSHNTMYISFAAPNTPGSKASINAFDRAFTKLDMTPIFATPPPADY